MPAVVLLTFAVGQARGRRVGAAAWLGCLGALSLTTIGIQERLETFDEEVRPVGWLLLEEGTEVAGGLLILAAVLLAGSGAAYAAGDLGAFRRRLPANPVVAAAGLAVAWIVASVAFEVALGSSPADDQEGLPQWWFAGTAALAASAGVALVARRLAPDRHRRAAWALAAVALLLAVHHGCDGTTWIGPMFGGRAAAVRAALAVALLLLVAAGFAGSRDLRPGAAGLGVASLLAFRADATDPLDVVVLAVTALAVVAVLQRRIRPAAG